jgi:CRISPR-associated endonuclease Cas1
MFTSKDIEHRTIFVINCIKERNLRVMNGELLLEEAEEKRTLTKMPFQKILALFVIGHISVTTPLIEKCKKFGVALIVVKPNLRPVFYWSDSAEANFLLRQRQHLFAKDDLHVAKALLTSKVQNQITLLRNTRRKDQLTEKAIADCTSSLNQIPVEQDYQRLMGLEGFASKAFFSAYFQDLHWKARCPRAKCDVVNVSLDIGYTILFNFVECYLRMFGFDLYVGVFHRLWFKRKSLVCDVMEPFRCIIDRSVRTAFHRKQFTEKDFKLDKGEWILRRECSQDYYKVYVEALIPFKTELFRYIQAYYRAFMRKASTNDYPQFSISP